VLRRSPHGASARAWVANGDPKLLNHLDFPGATEGGLLAAPTGQPLEVVVAFAAHSAAEAVMW
jgi:hypothetical protein